MTEDDTPLLEGTSHDPLPDAEAHLLAHLRGGDVEAGHRFVRNYYPAVYRYLLYLTGHRESAEDLTQETFLQAWRHLGQFQGRAPLRLWLHQIARREFLHARRRERAATSLEEVTELSEPLAGGWTDEAELRVLLNKLPEEQREVMVLHYLAGYSSSEIAQIIRAPASTVRYRLGAARSRLAEELGEGDLVYLNEPAAPMRSWAWLPLSEMYALETRLGGIRCSVFGVRTSEPTTPNTGHRTPNPDYEATKEEPMERREFLRQAAVGAAALALPESEKEIVDSRLAQKVTCAFKGTALSDLCDRIRSDTGIQLTAGPSVADEKVTLFCEKRPLREVMRQLSRPFGYTWLRSGTPGQYRYELVQDLRSQLLEEELRNRDRNAALMALEGEIERYRPYLDLSPDEALERARSASPEEKKLLETLASTAWGPIQMYFRLSRDDQAAFRAGQWLIFSADPKPGEKPLPADLARGALQCLRGWRLVKVEGGFSLTSGDPDPRGLPLTAVRAARAQIKLHLSQSELGQFTFEGLSGVTLRNAGRPDVDVYSSQGPPASGRSAAILAPASAAANAKLARDPALRSRVTVQPQCSCGAASHQSAAVAGETGEAAADVARKATTADVLEALHRAAGMPILSDYYTRLYRPEAVSVRDQPLFEALNQLADGMRLRWQKDAGTHQMGAWFQFRSSSYYNDRIEEVPNRLLSRWTASRRKNGTLTLDDIVEIAQLPDAELDGSDMAEGGRLCFGLAEWDLARYKAQRPHLRYLATFTPSQRQEMQSATGLPFTRMSLAQQQQFLALGLPAGQPLQSLEELAGATLRVDYTVPGWFQWGNPDQMHYTRWIVPLEPGPHGYHVLRPPVRERTREAALAAVRRVNPKIREALAEAWRRDSPPGEATTPSEEAQIFPTQLNLTIIYVPGSSNARPIRVWFGESDLTFWTF